MKKCGKFHRMFGNKYAILHIGRSQYTHPRAKLLKIRQVAETRQKRPEIAQFLHLKAESH